MTNYSRLQVLQVRSIKGRTASFLNNTTVSVSVFEKNQIIPKVGGKYALYFDDAMGPKIVKVMEVGK